MLTSLSSGMSSLTFTVTFDVVKLRRMVKGCAHAWRAADEGNEAATHG